MKPQSSHFVGSRSPLKLKDDVKSTAVYGGTNDEYRYSLIREWDPSRKRILWLLMNPSVATETGDDPTVAKCQRFSRKWGYGSMAVANSFAYRCTDQKRLLETPDAIGPDNNTHILRLASEADKIMICFGTPHHKELQGRGVEVADMLRKNGHKLYVLKLSTKGRPYHPLYLSEKLEPILWEGN